MTDLDETRIDDRAPAATVRRTVARVLSVPEAAVTDAADLKQDLGADSLDLSEIGAILTDCGYPLRRMDVHGARTVAELTALAASRAVK